MSIPKGYKKCSKNDNCAHPEGPILPHTIEYFPERKKGTGKFRKSCRECERVRLKNKNLIGKHRERYRYNSDGVGGAEYQREWRKNNKEKTTQYYKNRLKDNPNKVRAKNAVNRTVAKGELPHITAQSCRYCSKQAQQYHHWSYKKEHWLDVIPLCIKCHKKLHRKRD